MAKASQSKTLAKLKKRSKGAWSRSRETEAKAKGQMLPGGITKGVAQLSSYKLDEDKNGDPYFSITGIVMEPEEFAGMKAVTFHSIKETKQKTVEDKLDGLSSDIQLLGGEVDGTDLDDLPGILKGLVEDSPFYFFNTWAPDETRGAFVFIQGLAEDYEGEADGELPEGDDDEPESDADGDPEGEGEVEIVEGSIVLVDNEDEEDDPWEGTVTALDADAEEATVDDGDGGEWCEPLSVLTLVEPEAEAEAEADPEPEADGEGEPEWEPAKAEIYSYKASPQGTAQECEVVSVNKDKETVSLKRISDGKKFTNVSWDKLEGEEE